MPWRRQTAVIQVAPAKFRKESQLPEASRFIATITYGHEGEVCPRELATREKNLRPDLNLVGKI